MLFYKGPTTGDLECGARKLRQKNIIFAANISSSKGASVLVQSTASSPCFERRHCFLFRFWYALCHIFKSTSSPSGREEGTHSLAMLPWTWPTLPSCAPVFSTADDLVYGWVHTRHRALGCCLPTQQEPGPHPLFYLENSVFVCLGKWPDKPTRQD